MNDRPEQWKGRRQHTCSVCQKVEPWGPTWGWYGSIQNLDDDKPIVKACSEGCFKEAKAMKLIPMNTQILDEDE